MENEKNTFTRRYMADYLLAWSQSLDTDEYWMDAVEFAGMTDSELAERFYKQYEEMQGIVPPPDDSDVDPYDGLDY